MDKTSEKTANEAKTIEVKMDASGRVCIPKDVRKQLGLTYWDELPISFDIELDEITLRPEYYIYCDDDDGNMIVDGEIISPQQDGIKWDRELRMRVISKSSGMDIGRIKQTTTVSLDKSGRICVPKNIRAQLGLFPGFKFKADVDVYSDTITLHPLRKSGADTRKGSSSHLAGKAAPAELDNALTGKGASIRKD